MSNAFDSQESQWSGPGGGHAKPRARRSRGFKITAILGGLVLAAGATIMTGNALAADELPSDDAIVRSCGGDPSAMPSGTAVESCKANLTELGRKKKVTGVSNLFIDNCNFDTEAGIEGTGSYAQSRTWSFEGGFSLAIGPFLEIGGGGGFSQGDETSQSITGTFPVSPRSKAQIVYAQEFADTDGTYEAVVATVDGPSGSIFRDTVKIQRRAEAPIANARGGISKEEVPCDQDFQNPVGDVKFAR